MDILAKLKGVLKRAIRLSFNSKNSKYETRIEKGKGGKLYKIRLSSIEEDLQLKYIREYYDTLATTNNIVELHNFQTKKEQIISFKQREMALEEKLKYNPKILVVDEIDYLFSNKHTIETLRDIHDKLGIPILLVGMELADKKLQKYGHINDRIFAKLKFEKLSKEDFREIIETLSEVKFSDNAIKYITNRNLQFRQIVKVITKAEQLANTNKLSEISEEIIKGVINEE